MGKIEISYKEKSNEPVLKEIKFLNSPLQLKMSPSTDNLRKGNIKILEN